jgi:hypothetical protein
VSAPRSGKDTFIKFIQQFSEEEVLSFSSVDYIKYLTEKHLDININNKTPELRKFLSEFKRILTEYNDYSFKSCVNAIESLQENQHLILQVRELSEIEKIKKAYPNVVVVSVERDTVPDVFGNKSDDEVKGIQPDLVIYNYGSLIDLSKTAQWFVSRYIHE